ncbi:MAG: cytochrome c oxidase subunit [Ilumatobacteraceae bacterium]|nr:cytochrome c oxidase subunit [Ilumatobacteraceae bacterium]
MSGNRTLQSTRRRRVTYAALVTTIGVESVDGAPPSSRSRDEPHISAVAVGVIVWLASELMFFSGLFAAYFTLRATTDPWPPPGVELDTARTAMATAVLVASSVTMHIAVGSAHRDDRRSAAKWLTATLCLGALFVANQGVEYAQSTFSISSHAYGSMFYLMTGFHGIHVIGGLVFMGAVIWMISGRSSRAPAAQTLEMCAYYWHFVDVVWVVMFLTLYVLR